MTDGERKLAVKIQVRFSNRAADALKAVADEYDVTTCAVIRELVEYWIDLSGEVVSGREVGTRADDGTFTRHYLRYIAKQTTRSGCGE